MRLKLLVVCCFIFGITPLIECSSITPFWYNTRRVFVILSSFEPNQIYVLPQRMRCLKCILTGKKLFSEILLFFIVMSTTLHFQNLVEWMCLYMKQAPILDLNTAFMANKTILFTGNTLPHTQMSTSDLLKE